MVLRRQLAYINSDMWSHSAEGNFTCEISVICDIISQEKLLQVKCWFHMWNDSPQENSHVKYWFHMWNDFTRGNFTCDWVHSYVKWLHIRKFHIWNIYFPHGTLCFTCNTMISHGKLVISHVMKYPFHMRNHHITCETWSSTCEIDVSHVKFSQV